MLHHVDGKANCPLREKGPVTVKWRNGGVGPGRNRGWGLGLGWAGGCSLRLGFGFADKLKSGCRSGVRFGVNGCRLVSVMVVPRHSVSALISPPSKPCSLCSPPPWQKGQIESGNRIEPEPEPQTRTRIRPYPMTPSHTFMYFTVPNPTLTRITILKPIRT